MPVGTDAQELRALQQKAYGRGGALTPDEADRLRDLEEAHRNLVHRAAEPPAGAESSGGVRPPADPSATDSLGIAGSPGATDFLGTDSLGTDSLGTDAPAVTAEGEAHQAVPTDTSGGVRRRSAMVVVAVAAVVLAIGVGAGWALFSPRLASVPLTDAQQQRRVELVAEEYDAGSVRAIAQTADALAWYATRGDGESVCLILDVGDQSQADCRPPEERERGLMASLPLPADDGEDPGGSDFVQATMFLTDAGEPMVGMQRWGVQSGVLDLFEGTERDRAAALVEEGYELGLSIMGYFRGAPVWLGDRVTEQGATERCLIVDAGGATACEPFERALSSGLGVHVVDVDPTGGVVAASVLDLRFTTQQTPYLTVTADASAVEATPGDSLIIQSPLGDPIEVEPPGHDPRG